MIKLILTALVVVGGGIFWVWKRYGSKGAAIARKKKKLRQIRREMRDAIRAADYDRYQHLLTQRKLCNQAINDLRG